MGAKTGIEWTDATWNPLRGCSRVSQGCVNCYAETIAARFSGPGQPFEGLAHFAEFPNGTREARWTGKVALASEKVLAAPLHWRKPRRIFVNSVSDLFHENVPDAWIDRIFAVMALCPQHIFQVLTKRPERMRAYINGHASKIPYLGRMPLERIHLEAAGHMEGDGGYMDALKDAGNVYSLYLDAPWPLPNVWLGTSVEDQATANERIPHLLATPAAKRFISAEPLLGPVDLSHIDLDGHYEIYPLSGTKGCEDEEGNPLPEGPRLDWVIVGGESGPNARPMHPDWARSLRDQCAAAGVPFFFKQWGEFREFDDGSPAISKVYDDSVTADEMFARAINPSFILRDGTHILKRERLPAYEPCRLIERVGKSVAGAMLDGRQHREFPA